MAYELLITFEAEQDIDETVLWYQDEQPDLGIRFHFAVLEGFEKLKSHPQHYSFFRQDYRQLLLKRFSFKIIFKIVSRKVIVFGIFHTSRDMDELFNREIR
jgi:plasmid stabilization system protein ParE